MVAQQGRSEPENPYPLPLYLNQKYVFDLLAMMEEGFSQLQNVKTTEADHADTSRRYSGDLGVKNVFAFLGISLGGERASKNERAGTHEVTAERVYTPNALFTRMREWLYEDVAIVRSQVPQAKPGDFVEFKVTLQKNPLIDALEGILSLMETVSIFQGPQRPGSQSSSSQKGRVQGGSGPKSAASEQSKMMGQMRELLDQLNAQGTFDLVGTVVGEGGVRVVLTIDRAFLSDPSLSDLVDGEYTVLGKVTKVIGENGGGRINLLRKTSLGRVQASLLKPLTEGLQGVQGAGFDIPELITEVAGPAVQVLRIAIFA